jgi:hypothetical protein
MQGTVRPLTLALVAWPALAAAQAGAVLTEAEAARLIAASPAVVGKAGRTFARVVEIVPLEDAGKTGWVVEFEWTEAGKVRKGVAPMRRTEDVKEEDRPHAFYSQGGFTIVGAFEDVGARQLIAQIQAQRVKAHEAAAIGDIRSVLTGEMAYAFANEGFYDELRCLAEPTTCLPSYPKTSPAFLNASELQSEKLGYRRTFHPGAKAPRQAKASASSLTAFAYTAVPLKPGETGNRGFCGDASGRLCFTADGSAPKVTDGQCDAACTTLK